MAEVLSLPLNSTIRTTDGSVAHPVTPEELLWLGRAMAGEGGDHAAVLWTFVTGWAVKAPRQSLSVYVQSYSQAISPLWLANGACCCGTGNCPAGRSYCGDPAHCSDAQTTARARRRSLSWGQLPAAVQRTLISWAHGQLPNPVDGATDFAATRSGLISSKLARGWIKVGDLGGNTHLLPPDAVRPAGYVRVCGPVVCSETKARRDASPWVVGLLGLGLGASGVWIWHRYGRRLF